MRNQYKVKSDHVVLFAKYCGEVREVLVDLDVFERVRGGPSICVQDNGYAVRYFKNERGVTTKRYLHRDIMNASDMLCVDHIDHNPLNNRKCNLKIVTKVENGQNRAGLSKNSTSGHRGVTWHRKSQKWMVQAGPRCSYYVGLFTDLEEAIRAAEQARNERMPYLTEIQEGGEQNAENSHV